MGFWDSISDGFSDVGNVISSGVTTAADTVANVAKTGAGDVANVAKTGAGDVVNFAKNTVLKTGMDILGKVFSLLGLGGKDPSNPSSDDTSYAYIILAVGGAFAVLLILMLLELFL